MTKEKDYQAAADWAEHDMTLKPGTTTALRGEAAAAQGRAALERAQGGRPSIDPNAKPGQHSRTRQVRLPHDINTKPKSPPQRTIDLAKSCVPPSLNNSSTLWAGSGGSRSAGRPRCALCGPAESDGRAAGRPRRRHRRGPHLVDERRRVLPPPRASWLDGRGLRTTPDRALEPNPARAVSTRHTGVAACAPKACDAKPFLWES